MSVPLEDGTMDAVVSQEAFCHVPDPAKALSEARRILRRDGKLTFTDWIADEPLVTDDARLMWDGMAIQPLRSIPDYRRLVESAGFKLHSATDLTTDRVSRAACDVSAAA